MKKVHNSPCPQSDHSRHPQAFHQAHPVARILCRICSAGIAALSSAVLLIPSVWAAATPSAPDASGYEIPLGELNKVKKERPSKKVTKERKRRKGERSAQRASTDVVAAPGNAAPPATAPAAETSRVVPPPATPGAEVPHKSGHPQASATVTIHHDPYSYVITGKRTIIQAVISSAGNIQSVQCRFRASEDGAYALVPMVLVPGTLFTYTATLPSLAKESQALRYSIVVLDAQGHEARSEEYVIAVKSSAVLPGWQLEAASEPIKIRLENKEKPLEGFADPGVVE